MKAHMCFIQLFGPGEAQLDSSCAVTSFSTQDLMASYARPGGVQTDLSDTAIAGLRPDWLVKSEQTLL